MSALSWDQQIRWQPFVNDSDEDMPAFGCGALPTSTDGDRVTSCTREVDGIQCLIVRKPDALAERQCNPAFIVFNGARAVKKGRRGLCTQDMPAMALRAGPFVVGNVDSVTNGFRSAHDITNDGERAVDGMYTGGPSKDEWLLREGSTYSVNGWFDGQVCMVDAVRPTIRTFHKEALTSVFLLPLKSIFGGGSAGSIESQGTFRGRSDVVEIVRAAGSGVYRGYNGLFRTDDGYPYTHTVTRDGIYWLDIAISAATAENIIDTPFSFRVRLNAYDGESNQLFDTHLVSHGAEDFIYSQIPGAQQLVYSRYSISGWLPLKKWWSVMVMNEHSTPIKVHALWSTVYLGELPEVCDVPWASQLYGAPD